MPGIWIGTSGFSYAHWRRGVFYPPRLSQTSELEFYSKTFRTVELNNPFYRLPSERVFEAWRERTPVDFLFAVKASRSITHLKRLKSCEEALEKFLDRARHLRKKLGPVLFQLPPRLEADLNRLQEFLSIIPPGLRCAMEFRHPSWLVEGVYSALESRGVALCLPHASWMPPHPDRATASFTYLRLHAGSEAQGGLSEREIEGVAQRIRAFGSRLEDVYVYFNNDQKGHAVKNALRLREILGVRR